MYATLADLVDRFGQDEIIQLTDKTGAGVVVTAAVDLALSDAGAEIDAALIGRYALPIAGHQDLLTRIACDLARESLYADRPTDTVKDRAKTCRQILVNIAAGRMSLDLPGAPATSPAQSLVQIQTGRRHSPFGG